MSSKQKSTYEKRKEILDSPYRNGVASITGEGLGIRAMTEAEANFLDKFNSEFGCANISYNELGLHEELMEKNAPEIVKIENRIKELKTELSNIKYTKSGPPLKTMRKTEIKREINRAIKDLESELLDLDVVKSIRHDNYARSQDPLNYQNAHINILDVGSTDYIRDNSSESAFLANLEEEGFVKT